MVYLISAVQDQHLTLSVKIINVFLVSQQCFLPGTYKTATFDIRKYNLTLHRPHVIYRDWYLKKTKYNIIGFS